MAELITYPGKEFDIILSSGKKISGKFGTWSTKRMCQKRGIDFFEIVIETEKWVRKATEHNNKLKEEAEKNGTEVQNFQLMPLISFDDMCQRVLCAVEYKAYKEKKGFAYTEVDVCEWLEELGEKSVDLIRMDLTELISEEESKESSDEKKS